MKKAILTVKDLKKLFNKASKQGKNRGKLVGFIGGIPIYANIKVPYGELWVQSEKEFIKLTSSDL